MTELFSEKVENPFLVDPGIRRNDALQLRQCDIEDLGDGFGSLAARSSSRLDAPIAGGARVRILLVEAQTFSERARQVGLTQPPFVAQFAQPLAIDLE